MDEILNIFIIIILKNIYMCVYVYVQVILIIIINYNNYNKLLTIVNKLITNIRSLLLIYYQLCII